MLISFHVANNTWWVSISFCCRHPRQSPNFPIWFNIETFGCFDYLHSQRWLVVVVSYGNPTHQGWATACFILRISYFFQRISVHFSPPNTPLLTQVYRLVGLRMLKCVSRTPFIPSPFFSFGRVSDKPSKRFQRERTPAKMYRFW